MTDRRARGEALELVLKLAARPEGVTVADVSARMGDASNTSRLRNLGSRGHIFPAPRRDLKETHWFDTAERAKEWQAMARKRSAPDLTAKVVTKAERPVVREQPVVSIKSRAVGAHAPGEPIVTPKTRITIDSTRRPTARWQMLQEAPDERWPSFAATPLGVNPDTGRPWA